MMDTAHGQMREESPLSSVWDVLHRLPATGLWLWLVRPGALETVALLSLILLDRLSGLLVALGGEALRHG